MPVPRRRDDLGRFTDDDGRRFEVTVWNLAEGEIVKKAWDATTKEVAEIQKQYEDEPYHDINVEER